jgi:hypothetical protein
VADKPNVENKPVPRVFREHVLAQNTLQGIWRDEIYKKGLNGEDVLVETIGPRHNIITQPFTNLLTALLLNDPAMTGGILYHAIGKGDPLWDTTAIPDPSKFDVQLLDELDRRAPDGITYIKYGNGKAVSGTTTTILDPERTDPIACVIGRFEPDNFFNGMTLLVTAGTNVGESRIVMDYTQSTGEIVVTVPFPLPIDSTSEYEFTPISSASPTNALEVRTTWDYPLPSDPIAFNYIREQGLFGGNATGAANSGFLIDRITHDRLWYDCTTKIVRFIDIISRV